MTSGLKIVCPDGTLTKQTATLSRAQNLWSKAPRHVLSLSQLAQIEWPTLAQRSRCRASASSFSDDTFYLKAPLIYFTHGGVIDISSLFLMA